MAEEKKDEVSLKSQIRVLKAGIKEERKKSAQLTEDVKSLNEKLVQSEEYTHILVRNKRESCRTTSL